MRIVLLLIVSMLTIAGARAQSFNSYTASPFTGCCNGTFTGTPLPTDTVAINRPTNGINATASLPLSSFASAADIQNVNGRINQAFQQVDQSTRQLEHGVAAAVAMGSAFMPSAPGRTSWVVNGATFNNAVGAGLSIAHRLNFSVPIAVTASYGNGGANANVARLGLMGEF